MRNHVGKQFNLGKTIWRQNVRFPRLGARRARGTSIPISCGDPRPAKFFRRYAKFAGLAVIKHARATRLPT